MTGAITFPKSKGLYLGNDTGTYAGIFDNGNLLIGTNKNTKAGTHHTGAVYISAGLTSDGYNDTIYIIRPTNGVYKALHVGNWAPEQILNTGTELLHDGSTSAFSEEFSTSDSTLSRSWYDFRILVVQVIYVTSNGSYNCGQATLRVATLDDIQSVYIPLSLGQATPTIPLFASIKLYFLSHNSIRIQLYPTAYSAKDNSTTNISSSSRYLKVLVNGIGAV